MGLRLALVLVASTIVVHCASFEAQPTAEVTEAGVDATSSEPQKT
jgi:hypothetical protein